MDNQHNEPQSPVPSFLEGSARLPAANASEAIDALPSADQRRHDVDNFLAAYERIAPEGERRDGWSPFLRRLFLQVIAETGKVSTACAYTGMSRSSAYALQARDRVFAAGWDAACHFARMPLADDLYEKGIDGITETITRSDGVAVTRHRYDSRLSIAVLNRLDRRCDRAEERGSVHLAAVRNWDEYLRLVGKGEDKAAEALLDTAQDCPTCPLPERANPIPVGDPPGSHPWEDCWKDDRGVWMTCFPPPPGFDGYENSPWDGLSYYERTCTPGEVELIEAHSAAAIEAEARELDSFCNAKRDKFFGALRSDLARWRDRPT